MMQEDLTLMIMSSTIITEIVITDSIGDYWIMSSGPDTARGNIQLNMFHLIWSKKLNDKIQNSNKFKNYFLFFY